jgi:plasmid maintenance system antidote protein VapI
MAHPLHEKIEHALAQRGLLKRDLARALSVSPQTATDICKGRSAVTLPHLRGLVALFGLRADYWLDDSRLASLPGDEVQPLREQKFAAFLASEVGAVADPVGFADRLLAFAREQRDAFAARCPSLADDERSVLSLPRRNVGHVGQVAQVIEVTT